MKKKKNIITHIDDDNVIDEKKDTNIVDMDNSDIIVQFQGDHRLEIKKILVEKYKIDKLNISVHG